MIMNAIETVNITFRYGKNFVLNDLNIKIPEGSIYGFVGCNGAGKTTSIKLMLGILPLKTGSLFVFGDNIKKSNRKIMNQIGAFVDGPFLYSHFTCYEQMQYFDMIYKMGKDRIKTVLEIVGLWNEREKKVKNLSFGMKQRLGLGVAIFHDPKIILLDEPLNGLDPFGVHDMRELFRRLNGEGKTLLISSHILSELEKICTHIGIIDGGNLVYQDTLENMYKINDSLETTYMDLVRQNYENSRYI